MSENGPRRRPTIHSVAERAGVSKSLVSLVMRNAPHVSPERRQAVLRAAQELGYRPNAVARSLVEGRTRAIGVLVRDLRNSWYVDILDGLRSGLTVAGTRVLIDGGSGPGGSPDVPALEAFGDLGVEGVCLIGSFPYHQAVADASRSIPTVVTSTHDYDLPSVDIVGNDDVHGAGLAVDHLVALGHRDIAHLGGDGTVGRDRKQGYQQAMCRHGLLSWARVEKSDYHEEAGYAAATRLLTASRPPTAIVALNDLAAIGALSAATVLGIDVPGRLSVIGYDNIRLAALPNLSLSSIDPASAEVGQLAAERLLQRIGSATRPAHRDLITPRLVARRTTGPAPGIRA